MTQRRHYVHVDCPECHHRHLSDHEHVSKYNLQDIGSDAQETEPTVDAQQQSQEAQQPGASTPSPASPIGVVRGGLPGEAAQQIAALRSKRGRGGKSKQPLSDAEQKQQQQQVQLRTKTLVQLEKSLLSGFGVTVDNNQTLSLEMAWADFSEQWGFTASGKMFSLVLLVAAHAPIAMQLIPKPKEQPKDK